MAAAIVEAATSDASRPDRMRLEATARITGVANNP
jgi:hypothetical protein